MDLVNKLKDITQVLQDDDLGGFDDGPQESDNTGPPPPPPPPPKTRPTEPATPATPATQPKAEPADEDEAPERTDTVAPEATEDDHGEERAVNIYWQYFIVSVNIYSFFLCITVNFASQYFMPYTLREVTDDWKTSIDPSGWAFSIWGVIYTLLGMFVFYQALPSEWIVYRNDNMIYNQINLIFALNMIANAAWLPCFQSNTLWGFIISWLLIIFILVTNIAMMVITDHNEVWWPEILFVRAPITLYTGWITAATILNTSYMLKSWGMADDLFDATGLDHLTWGKWMTFGIDEIFWAMLIIGVANVIYGTVSWAERNPLYGAVWIWALSAIIENTYSNKLTWSPWSMYLVFVGVFCLTGHIINMMSLVGYLMYEELQPNWIPAEYWRGGLVSNVDYGKMFYDLKIVMNTMSKFFVDTYASRKDLSYFS